MSWDAQMRIVNRAWVLGCVLCMMAPARGADLGRGRMLYEARCTPCHATSVHQRSARKATSFGELRAQVVRWSAELGSVWSVDEVDDVTTYLNERYYSFPCPENMCRGNRVASGRILFHSRTGKR